MNDIAYEDAKQDLDKIAAFFIYEISDDALEAAAGAVLMSGSSNPGVNCTGGCKK